MLFAAVLSIEREAEVGAISAEASNGEESMSSPKFAIVEEEMVIKTVDSVEEEKHPKPFVVPHKRNHVLETLTHRVEAILDSVFKHGSMPA